MIRIEFEKNKGGVTNIINGSLTEVNANNKDIDGNVDKMRINAWSFSPIGFNYDLKALQIAGFVIIFNELTDMDAYLKQIDMFDGEIFNPGVTGTKTPDWDVASRDKTEGIVPHTYVDTDVEQDAINGN